MAKASSSTRTLERLEHTLYGGILYGVEGFRIELQARYFGMDEIGESWNISITGMAKGAIKEVQERIAGAFAKYGYQEPKGDILINLEPAGRPKEGTKLH